MARELTYTIQVLSEQAEAKVRRVEQAMKDATKAAGSQGFAKAERELESALKDADRAADKLNVTLARQKDAMAGADRQTQSLVGMVTKLGSAAGVAFSVQSVVAFTQSLIDSAREVTRMARTLTISTDAMQGFRSMASEANVELRDIADSMNIFQRRSAEGLPQVIDGMRELGLSASRLRAEGADQQFADIAMALQKIPDPAEQARLAFALFGDKGREILPALKSDVSALGDETTRASKESIKALDDWGRAWDRFVLRVKAKATEAGGGLLGSLLSERRQNNMIRLSDPNDLLVPPVSSPPQVTAPGARSFRDLEAAVLDTDIALGSVSKQMSRASEVAAEQKKKIEDDAKATREAAKAHDELAASLQKVVEMRRRAGGTELVEKLDVLPGASALQKLPRLVSRSLDEAAKSTRNTFRNLASDISGILDNIGGKWAEFAAIVSRTVTSVMDRLQQGDVVGAVSAGVAGAISAIAKVWTDEEKSFNRQRQSFVDSYGGLAQLNEKAHEAGTTLTNMLNARTVEDYERAIADLTHALDLQDASMQFLDDTLKKYGFTLDTLSPAAQARQITTAAVDLYKELEALSATGMDKLTILANDSVRKSLQQLVSDAMRTGQALPEQLRPWVQALIDAGKLVDATGKQLTDIGQVSFADNLTTQFDRLMKSIQDLVNAIQRGLGIAQTDYGRGNRPGQTPRDKPLPQDAPIPMADGGYGRVTGPTLFYSAGNEDFWFSGEGKRGFPWGQMGSEGLPATAQVVGGLRDIKQSIELLRADTNGEDGGPVPVIQILLDGAIIADSSLRAFGPGGTSESKFAAVVKRVR